MTKRHTSHTKRIAAPKRYDIQRKEATYLIKSNPGPHKKDASLPMVVVLRDALKLVSTSREAEKILNERQIMIDQKIKTNKKLPVGLMDVISVPSIKLNCRTLFRKDGKVKLMQIDEKESKIKLCKILNKTKTKKGAMQLNLHDGRNLLVKEDAFNTGDTLMLSLPDQKIIKHIKLEKGTNVYITEGKHVGENAKVIEFKPQPGSHADRILLKNEKDESFETLKKYVFATGQEKPEIKIGE